MKETIDFDRIIPMFDKILKRGLCVGIGEPDGQMCVEAAISQAIGIPFTDQPHCVSSAIRAYKIELNDCDKWTSPKSRAKGLRNLGIAQIGSAGIVDDREFSTRLAEKTIRILIPRLFRALKVTREDPRCMVAADRCESEGSEAAADGASAAAAKAADRCESEGSEAAADDASAAAACAASCASAAAAKAACNAGTAIRCAAADAAYAARNAVDAVRYATDESVSAGNPEEYLLLSASLALEVLQELKSPGCEWIDKPRGLE